MKKILVLSDTHNGRNALARCLRAEQDADALIFLGDGCSDLDRVLPLVGWSKPVYAVSGNCDFNSLYPAEGLAPFEGSLVFYTHGHLYDAGLSFHKLWKAAMAQGADVALFGHTHIPFIREEEGFASVYNPGSVFRPRGPEGPTYGLLFLQQGTAPRFEVKPVPKAAEGDILIP